MGSLHVLPGVELQPAPLGLNLLPHEVQQAAGGYKRPSDQLQELHRRGFARAYRRGGVGPVILERAHYDAVVRGQFGQAEVVQQEAEEARPAPRANRAALARFFSQKAKK